MATKPLRIQSKQVFAYVGGTPTRRVQSFDWASNFTIDSVFELGNTGIVEDSVTLVESSITMNSNEWGTTDLEAMVFGIFEQRPVVKNANNTLATLIVAAKGAGGDWNSVGNATVGIDTWLQVIRASSSATVNTAEYVRVDAISAVSGGTQKITLDPSFRMAAAATGGDIVSIVNKYTITQDTVDTDPVHLVLPHRLSSSSTVLVHSVALPRAYVDNLTYRIDTGGASEQNYTLVGEEERFTLNRKRELSTVTGSFVSYGSKATVMFTVPRNSAAALGSAYICYADSNLATAKFITPSTHGGGYTISARIGSGLGVDSSSQIVYYSFNPSPKGWKGLTNIDSGIGKLTKGYVEILFGTSTTAPEKLQRCTGIDISVPLTRESIDELGESRSIGKPLEGNLRNEVTLTFNRNDLREYAMMLDDSSNFDNGLVTEVLIDDLKAAKTIKILVKFYNNQTTHDATTLLKTMTFTNCNFIGDNTTTPISGASGLELKFSTQSLSVVGSGLPPVYSSFLS